MGLLDTLNQLNPIAQGAGLIQSALSWGKGKPHTDQAQYDNLVHYFKYASSAYALIKLGRLNGAHIVAKMFDLITDSHGYVARDDNRKEIIVAFRGSVTPANFAVDFMFIPISYNESLVPGATLHTGFKTAWATVKEHTINAVREQIAAHPDYAIITLGHSLGGAMASISGVELKENFPNTPLRIYTYGAPRVGNDAYAKYATDKVGVLNVHRVVHACDGVPTMVPTALGFKHFGTEYWHLDPSGASKTFICNGAGIYDEDPQGSARVPSTGINPDHLVSSFGNTLRPAPPLSTRSAEMRLDFRLLVSTPPRLCAVRQRLPRSSRPRPPRPATMKGRVDDFVPPRPPRLASPPLVPPVPLACLAFSAYVNNNRNK